MYCLLFLQLASLLKMIQQSYCPVSKRLLYSLFQAWEYLVIGVGCRRDKGGQQVLIPKQQYRLSVGAVHNELYECFVICCLV